MNGINLSPHAARIAQFLAVVVAAVSLTGCHSSPAAPTTASVSGVVLTVASAAVGGSGQAMVTLTAQAPADGANILLTSSTPAVATVQGAIMIPAGSTSVTFSIPAVTVGTTVITASLDGVSRQTGTFTVTASPVSLASIGLSSPSVVGGISVTGTAVLTANAPAGGVLVTLTTSDPATVPPSVLVPAGLPSATFSISTRAVDASTTATINGAYAGVVASAILSVTHPTVATASFGVTGPTESETCTLINSGNTLDCTFNGSTSTAPGTITAWDWTYGVAATFGQTTTGPTLTMPTFSCNLLPPPPFPAGNQNFSMIVTLKIHDSLGNVATITDTGVRLLPQGNCGF